MAEFASAILALSVFALESSVALYSAVKSFQSHPRQVRDLIEELDALRSVLEMLVETTSQVTNADLSTLEIPLKRCGEACTEFQEELIKCCSRSSQDRTSFRDWARLKYMGDGIDGFRQQLAGYKSTITVALTDATLRTSSMTAKTLEDHKTMIKNAIDDLETHLQSIDERFEAVLGQMVTVPDADTAELRRIKQERLSTQKGLQICRQLSDHINEVQLRHALDRGKVSTPADLDPSPGKVVGESLQQCRDRLDLAASQLEDHTRKLMDRLMTKSKSVMSGEDVEDLQRLRDEWETTRQSRNICSRADIYLQENVSVVENYATGDETVQFLASTNEKTINGSNKGFGKKQRQIAGHFDNATIRQLSRDAFGTSTPPQNVGMNDDSSSFPAGHASGTRSTTEFSDMYGKGQRLESGYSTT